MTHTTHPETIRWGIIGCGDVAEHKSGPALYATPGSELVAVMRRDAALAADYARRHGARRWYGDASALVDDPDVSAVYIASPHGLHLEHVRLVARAGKMVLCEKPVGCSAADAREVVDVCKRHEVPLAVAYYRRFWPVVRAARELLDGAAIGEVLAARVLLVDHFAGDRARPWLVSRAQAGGGALSNTGSHWVDLLRHLLGEIVEVSADCGYAAGFEVEDTAHLRMRTAGGATASLLVTWRSRAPANELEIIGTDGRLTAAPLSEGRLTLWRPGRDPVTEVYARAEPAHAALLAELVPALRSGGPSPVPGEDAVAVWRIMEAAYRSCAERVPVALAPET